MVTKSNEGNEQRRTCCPCGHQHLTGEISRRGFLQGVSSVALASAAITGLSWKAVSAAERKDEMPLKRQPLKVKPILVYSTPRRRHQTSWRSWGGIQTEQDAEQELSRIKSELNKLGANADFPVEFMPPEGIKGAGNLSRLSDLDKADVYLIYAAGGGMDTFARLAERGKDIIFFCRHKSGPVYLWYEIISPRYLRQHTDTLALKGIDDGDVVKFVDNCFLLEQVFRGIMKKADCQAITINGCMGTIIPIAETTACLTLSLLNDNGYLAFCESDFVVIPSGVLLAHISGIPVFLNDPTYPHDGIITNAHCTAPRKMDGKKLEPARIMTHFESDYGAAPKVEMHKGQILTNIVPDFKAERWVGVIGEIVDAPFMDVCRSQIDIRFSCDSKILAERMPGFHWMTGYGDYMRELGYALKKVGIEWENLTA